VVLKDNSGASLLQQFVKERQDAGVILNEVKPDIEDCFISFMKAPAPKGVMGSG
jgi:hypothetical protein